MLIGHKTMREFDALEPPSATKTSKIGFQMKVDRTFSAVSVMRASLTRVLFDNLWILGINIIDVMKYDLGPLA